MSATWFSVWFLLQVGMYLGYTVILLVPHQQLVNWMLDTFNLL